MSSDIISALACDLAPQERGLVRDPTGETGPDINVLLAYAMAIVGS